MKRLLLSVLAIVIPGVAHAYDLSQSGWSCSGFLYCGAMTNVVSVITGHIVDGVFAFIGALAVVVFFYGAIRMVTSQGQEGKEAGKKALIYASLGIAAALLVRGVVQFICGYLYYLGGGNGTTVCP